MSRSNSEFEPASDFKFVPLGTCHCGAVAVVKVSTLGPNLKPFNTRLLCEDCHRAELEHMVAKVEALHARN